ncbi:MAG: iron-containing alcohol dehydrogenase [Parvibaculaceae bacterium]
MQSFTLAPVPEITFGPGVLATLPEKAKMLAGPSPRAMLVADPALKPIGITDRVMDALQMAGAAVALYEGFAGEPKTSDIDKATALARDAKADLIVALGGGSALDTGKLVACCAASGKSAEAYQLCHEALPAARPPVICIPTTAGTGSEATRTSVFTNEAGIKTWAWGAELKPELALLDPELTTGLPPAVTAATALDAMVHAIEASTNGRRFPANDLYCHRAIALIAKSLARAVKDGFDIEARGDLLLGSCYAGIGIDNAGTAVAHTISHALATLAPVPHGRGTAIGMAASIDWVAEGATEAFAAVAAAMGRKPEAKAAAKGFVTLARDAGLKLSLANDGLELNRPELLAERMALPENAPMRNATARKVSDDDLLMLAQRVYALR